MRLHKPFPRVYLAWGKWWAAQLYLYPCASFGIHSDPRRPLLDFHLPIALPFGALGLYWWPLFLAALIPLGVLTLAFGPAAHISGQEDRHRQSCRGFLFDDNSKAWL